MNTKDQSNKAIRLESGGLLSFDYLQHARDTFLSQDQEANFIKACGRPLRKSIRVNTLKCSINEFLTLAEDYGWQLTSIPWCEQGFWVEVDSKANITSLGNSPAHIQGLFYIQEASSMLPPVALMQGLIEDNLVVMDMAAAPGSKTTQLAAFLDNQGLLLANELSASRLKSLHNNLIRCGLLNTCLSHLDAIKIGGWLPNTFDAILLDAPCGGEGTVRKDANALADWNLESVKALGQLQKQLILSAFNALKPGGKLVYSTCTLSPEENQQIGEYLLAQTNAQRISLSQLFDGAEQVANEQGELLVLPHIFDSEGFFVAAFVKPEDKNFEQELAVIYDSPFVSVSKKTRQTISQYFTNHFGISIEPEGYELLQREKEIWIFPKAIEKVNRFLKVNRGGIRVAEIYPNKIRSHHEVISCLGKTANKQMLAVDKQQAAEFLRGQNLSCEKDGLNDGEVILTYQGYVLGLVQKQKTRLKNGLPRELVKDNFVI